ncbi:hypothetical protein DL546_008050 [Coniochaeta pulveracea]|uniref:Extracellular membrane protein CFEM domain-containing protein n=1 Tax=Coniochaeta pulveracea TaxID=177199 RepID=A0A420YC24_9PEZI|nr:hypothetical protein DL546_008050 [Coniochaeta pulveracea]
MIFTPYLIALVAACPSVLAAPADVTIANVTLANATLAPLQQVQNGTNQPLNVQDQLLGNNTRGLSKCFIKCVEEVGLQNITVGEFCGHAYPKYNDCIQRRGSCLDRNIFFNWLARLRDQRRHNGRRNKWIEKKCPKDKEALLPIVHL